MDTKEGCLEENKRENGAKSIILRMTPRFANPVIRDMLRESWAMGRPMILIMFFQFSIGMADIYVAGFLGVNVLAAVGYVGQLYWTLMILASALTVGCVSMVSQAHGAESSEGVSSITSQSIVIGLFISGILTLASQIYPSAIIRYAGMPDDIRDIAEAFLRIFSLVLIPTYVMIITGGILRASGRVRVAMINSCIAAIVNIVGDFAFSFGWGPIPAMGYRGIALGTASAATLGMFLNLFYIFYGPEHVTLGGFFRIRYRCIWNLIRLSFPSALQQGAWNAGTLVVYFLAGQLAGGQITALAAMTAGVRIEAIIFLPVFAFNMASAVLTGNRIGSGDVSGARAAAKTSAALCLGIILLPAALIFIFAPDISARFTSDQAVLEEMTRYLRINMLGMPFMALGVTLSGALQGAGDTYATMRIIFTGMWLIRIPLLLVVILVLRWPAVAIWWCMTVSMVFMCALLIKRFRGDRWIKASVDTKSKTLLWEACLDKE
jgi:multidrug resistance protein, MATE family